MAQLGGCRLIRSEPRKTLTLQAKLGVLFTDGCILRCTFKLGRLWGGCSICPGFG